MRNKIEPAPLFVDEETAAQIMALPLAAFRRLGIRPHEIKAGPRTYKRWSMQDLRRYHDQTVEGHTLEQQQLLELLKDAGVATYTA